MLICLAVHVCFLFYFGYVQGETSPVIPSYMVCIKRLMKNKNMKQNKRLHVQHIKRLLCLLTFFSVSFWFLCHAVSTSSCARLPFSSFRSCFSVSLLLLNFFCMSSGFVFLFVSVPTRLFICLFVAFSVHLYFLLWLFHCCILYTNACVT